MAPTTSDLVTIYSARTTTEINQRSVWSQFFNRNWEAELQGAEKVVIQDYDYNVTVSNANRGDDIKAPADISADQLTLTINKRPEVANFINYEDAGEIPVEPLSRMRAAQIAAMMAGQTESVERVLGAHVAGLTYATGQKDTFGTAGTDFVSQAGEGTGKGFELVDDAIRRFEIYCQRKALFQPGSLIGGGVGTPVVVMHPELHSGYAKWFAQTYGGAWEAVGRTVLQNSSILGAERFRGMPHGIPLFVTNDLAVPTGSSGGTTRPWKFYGITDQCNTFARKPSIVKVLDPSNPAVRSLNWEISQRDRYGFLEVNPVLKYEFTILSS